MFILVLNFIFNLSLSPNLWEQTAIFPVLIKGKTSSIDYYRLLAILNNFSKVFEFIIHDHVSRYLKSNTLLNRVLSNRNLLLPISHFLLLLYPFSLFTRSN
jgi:hypothetical protein